MAWTRAMDNRLYSLIRKGLNARQIADKMGVSRNAVIGRADKAFGGFKNIRNKPPKIPWNFRPIKVPPFQRHKTNPDPLLCIVVGCRSTRQPAKKFCNRHNPVKPRQNTDVVAVELIL